MSLLLKIFRESKELKRTIVDRSFEFIIPFRYICDEAGVNYQNFMQQYINVSGDSKFEISDDQIIKMLKTLAIDIRHQFVIDTTVDMQGVSRDLEEKYKV